MSLSFLHRIHGVREHSSARQYTQFFFFPLFIFHGFLFDSATEDLRLVTIQLLRQTGRLGTGFGSFRTMGVTASHSG
jgi:hypothetical protein